MIELLMRYGARVPAVSKWAPYYYFKHTEIAALLPERGMNPNHMNCHHFTLLHHMAAEGEMEKARLLIDHGAAINALDEEYRPTPLGCAVRRGQKGMVELLLARGADANRAGAPWANATGLSAEERALRNRDDVAAGRRSIGFREGGSPQCANV
jgi:ankyrin repeat protein